MSNRSLCLRATKLGRMSTRLILSLISLLATLTAALRFSSDQIGFNLNENQTAVDPLDYWGQWPNHTYHPSPQNWRMPAYTLFLDRFVNG